MSVNVKIKIGTVYVIKPLSKNKVLELYLKLNKMKKLFLSIVLIGSSFITSSVYSQSQIKDSLGLPGDNLNLYGVLDLFQQSKTLEEFENKLNAQDSKVNNLDLNGDNKIDYIKIVDNAQGTSHAIVLKDEISE